MRKFSNVNYIYLNILKIIKKFLYNINPARVINWLVILVILYSMFNVKYWNKENKVFYGDVISYYAYLPATFIYKDITLSFTENYKGEHKFIIYGKKTFTGIKAIKMTMGLSILYSPFFFLGHIGAKIFGYDSGGFSAPYIFALLMSCIFYLSIGLYFLRKILQHYFSKIVTAITIVFIVFGTNLFFYSSFRAPVSHAYSFSLIAIFLYLTIKWHERSTLINTILLGLISGLITLIRPTNVIVLIFILLWGVSSKKEFIERLKYFIRNYYLILIMIGSFIIVLIPQLLYWKIVSGHFIYYSYGEEGFLFANPQIIRGMFSYRNGWLVYSPIMILSLIGFLFLFRKQKEFFLPTLIFTLLNIYIILSWWCWWYVGFGQRAFIDSYSILAIPMAAFIGWTLKQKKLIKISILTVALLFFSLGVFHTIQYCHGSIHFNSMTKAAYWESFGKIRQTSKFWSLLESPDSQKAVKGIQAIKPKKKVEK